MKANTPWNESKAVRKKEVPTDNLTIDTQLNRKRKPPLLKIDGNSAKFKNKLRIFALTNTYTTNYHMCNKC